MASQIGGLSILNGGSKQKIQFYIDAAAFTQYICDNDFGVTLATGTRRVKRLIYDNATFDNLLTLEGGTPAGTLTYGEYVCTPTNLAAVQALIYA